jgi:hypothetical protein
MFAVIDGPPLRLLIFRSPWVPLTASGHLILNKCSD